jgi:hypothetical protein
MQPQAYMDLRVVPSFKAERPNAMAPSKPRAWRLTLRDHSRAALRPSKPRAWRLTDASSTIDLLIPSKPRAWRLTVQKFQKPQSNPEPTSRRAENDRSERDTLSD